MVFTAQALASKFAYAYAFFLLRRPHSVLFDHCSTGHSCHLPSSFTHQSLSLWQVQISFPTLVLLFASSPVTYLLTYLLTYFLTYSMEQSPSFEDNRFSASQKNSPRFLEPKSSLPHLQQLATCPYPEQDPSSPCTNIPILEDPS